MMYAEVNTASCPMQEIEMSTPSN